MPTRSPTLTSFLVALAGLLLGGSLFTAASRPAPPAPNRNWRSFSSPISPSLPMWFPSIAVIRPASSARSAAIPRTTPASRGWLAPPGQEVAEAFVPKSNADNPPENAPESAAERPGTW